MTNDICFVYPYYNNPDMLRVQVQNWNLIADEFPNFQVVLVDDNSLEAPAKNIFIEFRGKKKLYRFTEPACWTMHEARNLGAMEGGVDYDWLFMSDIDIVLMRDQFKKIANMKLDPWKNYTFDRLICKSQVHDEFCFEPFRYHCNTYLLRRDAYMQINGYDVDYCGAHGGGYGGDGEFERQLSRLTPREHLENIYVLGYGRTANNKAVLDSDTTEWDREEWKKKYREVFNAKRKHGDMKSYNPIRRAYERIM